MVRGLARAVPALWAARYGNAAALFENSLSGEPIVRLGTPNT